MPKTLIVGNTVAVIDEIRKKRLEDSSAEIVLFLTESVLPYNVNMLPNLLARDIKEALIYPEHDLFFSQNRVEVIHNERLNRISLKRKYLTTESKRQISYDQLIITDTGYYQIPNIKGHHKNGVYHSLSIGQIRHLHKNLMDIETVVVNLSHFQGLNLACALLKLKKEVLLTAPHGLLNTILDDESRSLLKQILEAKGMRIIDQEIEEILGDTDVKAIRLKSGKILAASAVIFDHVDIDYSMLSESELPTDVRVVKDEVLNVLQPPLQKPVYFGLGVLNGYAFGITMLTEGGREYLRFNGPENIFKKIYVLNDRIVGAVVFNAPDFFQPLTDLIINAESVLGREESLIEG